MDIIGYSVDMWKRYLFGGLSVGALSLVYNIFIFSVFDFYPDYGVALGWANVYVILAIKNFIVGFLLTFFFSIGYESIVKGGNDYKYEMKGIVFLVLYAVFALLAFSIGDLYLMKSNEGMLVLLTVDGPFETMLATIPVRRFGRPA